MEGGVLLARTQQRQHSKVKSDLYPLPQDTQLGGKQVFCTLSYGTWGYMGSVGVFLPVSQLFNTLKQRGGQQLAKARQNTPGFWICLGAQIMFPWKRVLNRPVQVMGSVHVLWPSRCNGLIRRNERNRGIAVSQSWGWLVYSTAD